MRYFTLIFLLFFSIPSFSGYPAVSQFPGVGVTNFPGIGTVPSVSGPAANNVGWSRLNNGRIGGLFNGKTPLQSANDSIFDVPTKMRGQLAKSAGRVAGGLIRLTPAYRTAAAAAFMLSLGLEYCADFSDYCKRVNSSDLGVTYSPWKFSSCNSNCVFGTPSSLTRQTLQNGFDAAKLADPRLSHGIDYVNENCQELTCVVDFGHHKTYSGNPNTWYYTGTYGFNRIKCTPPNFPKLNSNGVYTCVAANSTELVPVSDSEFNTIVSSDPELPIPLLNQLLNAGAALPIDLPEIIPVVDQPVGVPYVDPLTGDLSVPVANLQPANNLANPFNVNGAVSTAKADAAGNPIPGTATDPAPNPNPNPNPNPGGGDPTPVPTGPCDPTQKNYLQCMETNMKPFSQHTQSQAADFEAVFKQFKTRLDSSDLVQAINGFKTLVNTSGGQCPILSIDLSGTIIGRVISTSIHCDVLSSPAVRSTISAVMLVIWAFFAFRIFASA